MTAAAGLRFQGHAALFDRVDRAGDVFRAGAFAGAGIVPLLWQHRGAPAGTLRAVAEDARGLWVEGVVTDPDAARLVRGGALPGLSVGFRTVRARQGAWRELLAVVLIEVSLVATPMQPGARIERVDDDFQQEK
ncbi:HK97 family phage prohead protease [uncultured Sphingomonas sp.]|uniref:HK97 family phage prohead protease n=1 Tax=uncultured Sphingomonas sp. TaxID=158754 RepID=UPI0035CC6A06